jgi:hypothetical protein
MATEIPDDLNIGGGDSGPTFSNQSHKVPNDSS